MCCLIFICWWSSWIFCLDVNLFFCWRVGCNLVFNGDFSLWRWFFRPVWARTKGPFGAVWGCLASDFSTKKKNDGCCNVYLLFGVVGILGFLELQPVKKPLLRSCLPTRVVLFFTILGFVGLRQPPKWGPRAKKNPPKIQDPWGSSASSMNLLHPTKVYQSAPPPPEKCWKFEASLFGMVEISGASC